MERVKKEKLKKIFKEYLPYLIVIIGVILIKQFVVSPIIVNGESMMKTLHDKDVMFLNRLSYRFSKIERFDIVVIDNGSEYIIKRVIGMPGEEITCEDGNIFINGKKIKDSYGYGKTENFYYKVPKNEYYVLGDNRENSMDSRYFGSFNKKTILGKTSFIIFPFKRFGNKN